jgi:hypothetical protein
LEQQVAKGRQWAQALLREGRPSDLKRQKGCNDFN